MNDLVINKVQSIQRCIRRAREEYQAAGTEFASDYSRQDAAILNITRACEQAIDLANYVIKLRQWGIPNSSAESFALLARERLISLDLAERLRRMVGFRNIAVHEYETLDLAIVVAVIETGLTDLLTFADMLRRQTLN